MKKILGLLIVSALAVTSLYAKRKHVEDHESENNFYVATKAIYSLGTSVDEGEATLEGSAGAGLGLDVGYKLGAGFSVEADVAYVAANVTEKTATEERVAKATFTTTSFDVAYIYHVTHELEVFIKGGYELEFEKISDLDVDNTKDGGVYAVGFEYELSHTSAVAVEFEGTSIKGPRGSIASLGYVYSF